MELEIVKSYNYLGVKYDENLNFKDCIQTSSDAASRAFCPSVNNTLMWDIIHIVICLILLYIVPVHD